MTPQKLRLVALSVGVLILLGGRPGLAAEPAAVSQGRVEMILANEYRKDVEAITQEFERAGLSKVHVQFVRLGQPPPNIGLGRQVSAERAREALRLAVKYNRAVTILLPSYLFPPNFITIASSNFDDTVEFRINEQALQQLQDPSLSTEQFHALYSRLTTSRK